MTVYIGIDPGFGYAGVARADRDKHVTFYYVDNDNPVWVPENGDVQCFIEHMVVRARDGTTKAKSLLKVQNSAGRLTANIPRDRITQLKPETWKDQQTKAINHWRTYWTLTETERALIPVKQVERILARKGASGTFEHAFDAVGILLYGLGRRYTGQ